jgi:hypothetical protein
VYHLLTKINDLHTHLAYVPLLEHLAPLESLVNEMIQREALQENRYQEITHSCVFTTI